MIKVLNISLTVVMISFITVSITAPIAGVYVGGYIVDFMGGYKGSNIVNALKFCLIAGALASTCTIPVAISTTAFTEFISLWLLLFFGACIIPCAIGISVNSVERDYQHNSSSFAQLCFNIFGFFLSPVLSALVMQHFDNQTIGLAWGIKFVLCIS